ncbi:diguanylate cyclase [Marinobacter sp. VGCF2001]|uniref:GGDEF domain-containing protein n=1 Tax=Marinobacter sp. VGCF2001 TaxID=3417189 RepID=UPI003CEF1E5A
MPGKEKTSPALGETPPSSERFFRKLASSVPGVLFTYQVSADGQSHRFPFISDRVRDLFGIDPELLQGDAASMFTLIAEEDREGIEASIILSSKTLSPWCYQARMRERSGQLQWYEATSIPEQQADGSIIWYGQFINIDHYKALEQNLRKSEEEASYQARFQQMIAALSAEFIHLGFSTIDECIDQLLQAIGEFFQVDRAYVYAFADNFSKMTNTHEWCREGVTAVRESQQEVDVSGFAWWQAQIRGMIEQDKVVFVEDASALPAEAAEEKHLLQSQGVQSMICAPIIVRGQVMGFFGVDSLSLRPWRRDQSHLMIIVSGLLSGALERNQLEEELVSRSIRDPLTGLYNRRYLLPRMEEMLAACNRYGEKFCVVMFDIDHFKRINDSFGHLMGDKILQRFTALLNECSRTTDVVSRFGGEEFIVVFAGVNQSDVAGLTARIFQSVREEAFDCAGTTLRFTVSAGAVCVSELTEQPVTPEALISFADERLYRAKESGRNCLVDAFGVSRI